MLKLEIARNVWKMSDMIRHDWSVDEVLEILEMPLLDLVDRARAVHKGFHKDGTVQLSSLISIKTGGCPENCGYCSQSAHHAKKTGLKKEALMSVDDVLEKAKLAKEAGANRFCMGAAWRKVRNGEEFDRVLEMIKGVKKLGLEACVTLGMVSDEQAKRLAEAGLTSYNHNVDTSPEHYDKIVTTRNYKDRLDSLEAARKAGIKLCTGGIIGMGESNRDRASMLRVLANLEKHPESVPINALVAVKGTPMENLPPVDSLELVRMVATARIVMPESRVRLSAGRSNLTKEAQILCFMAGANSIFYGDKLLTTSNNDCNDDKALIEEAGLKIAS